LGATPKKASPAADPEIVQPVFVPCPLLTPIRLLWPLPSSGGGWVGESSGGSGQKVDPRRRETVGGVLRVPGVDLAHADAGPVDAVGAVHEFPRLVDATELEVPVQAGDRRRRGRGPGAQISHVLRGEDRQHLRVVDGPQALHAQALEDRRRVAVLRLEGEHHRSRDDGLQRRELVQPDIQAGQVLPES
jgi:hypothetical protein